MFKGAGKEGAGGGGGVQSLFGRHDISGIQAHSTAPDVALGAHAFTQGSHVAFAPPADHTVAHEAAHVVQQKEGRVAPTLADTIAPFAGQF